MGAVAVVIATALAATALAAAPIDPQLAAELESGDSARIIVLLVEPGPELAADPVMRRRVIATTEEEFLAAVGARFELRRRMQSIAAVAGRSDRAGVAAIAAHPAVRRVGLDVGGGGTLAEAVPLTRTDLVKTLGLTGAGLRIAVLDTGFDSDHPDLAGALVDEHCFCSGGGGCCPAGTAEQAGPGSAEDDHGHGTHVSGIVTSDGVVAPEGTAPDAGVVAVKVMDSNNSFCCSSDVIAGLDWIEINHPEVRAINMSLGTGQRFAGDCDTATTWTVAFADVINRLRAGGTMTFVSSGNDADTRMRAPACIAAAISVGAVYDADVGAQFWGVCGDPTTGADVPVCFTNADPTTDIYAPGSRIISSGIGGGPADFSGTSMASPHVAGCVLDLMQAFPAATPAAIEAAIESTGVPVTEPKNGIVYPRIDCLAAHAALDVVAPAPNPIPVLFAVRAGADVRTTWDDSPVDSTHAAAASYELYRSLTVASSGYVAIVTVADTPASREEAIDAGAVDPAPPRSRLHFYRVSAFNAGGDSGDVPPV